MERNKRRGHNPKLDDIHKKEEEEKVWEESELLQHCVESAAALGDGAALYQLFLSRLAQPNEAKPRLEADNEDAAHVLDKAVLWHCTPQVALAKLKAYEYSLGGEIEVARRVAGDMRPAKHRVDGEDVDVGEEEKKEPDLAIESSVEGDSWCVDEDPLGTLGADLIM